MTEMEPVTLSVDMFMEVHFECGCVSEGLRLHACIEWQEGILYLMCGNCGATKHWRDPLQETLSKFTR